MYIIQKEFTFEASHQLFGLPEGHPCSRLHGHGYRVRLVLGSGTLDQRGFVVDYGDLRDFKQMVDEKLDHRHLNDLLDQPSAENIAQWLFASCIAAFPWARKFLQAVRVSETQKTWAEYRP